MPHFDVAPGLKIWLETHDGFSCRTSCGRGSFLFILTSISPPPASPADAKSSRLPSTCRTDLQWNLLKPAVSPQVSALNPSEVPVSQTGTRSIDSPWSPCECLQVWKPAFLRCTGNLSRRSLSHPLSCSLHRRCSRPDPLESRVDTDKHREFVRCLCVGVSIQGTEANTFRQKSLRTTGETWRRGNRGCEVGTINLQSTVTSCSKQNAPAEMNLEDFWLTITVLLLEASAGGTEINSWSWKMRRLTLHLLTLWAQCQHHC